MENPKDLKVYTIEYFEKYSGKYTVAAKNKEDAEMVLIKALGDGLTAPETLIDCGVISMYEEPNAVDESLLDAVQDW